MDGIEGSIVGLNAGTEFAWFDDIVMMSSKRSSGLEMFAVCGVGVAWLSFRIANPSCQWKYWHTTSHTLNLQATERFGAGSVYFVLFGSGDAGKLGISCVGWGVDSSAIVNVHRLYHF